MTRTKRQRHRPRIRLIWDELLSELVPRALRVLQFNVTWVGSDDPDVPPRGCDDADVIAFAQRTTQIIVTSNHDMMTLCAEADQRFVWLDPRGRQLDRELQVLLAFQQIGDWERLLDKDPAMCVVARRTGCKSIAPAEAARLARNRMRSIERRKRRVGQPHPNVRRHDQSDGTRALCPKGGRPRDWRTSPKYGWVGSVPRNGRRAIGCGHIFERPTSRGTAST